MIPEVEVITRPSVDDTPDQVNHPAHYGGEDNPYETIKVITAWNLGFNLGNTVKYISRAGLKDESTKIQDLKKAEFYLQYEIKLLEQQEVGG